MSKQLMNSKAAQPAKAKKHSQFGAVMIRLSKNKSAITGMCIVLLIVLLSILAPIISPYNPETLNLSEMFLGPSAKHICGTDAYGRDLFTRLLYGARYSLGLAIVSQLLGNGVGVVLGCFAGFFGGKVDSIILRIMDIFQALPSLLFAIIISTVLGSGFLNTAIAIGANAMPMACRMTRAQFFSLRDMEYVLAAESITCSKPRIIMKHMLPNAFAPMIVNITMGIGSAIMNAASLSYIGLGVQPPTPEWGALLVSATEYIRYYPHLVIFPGISIALLVLAVNMFGDGLRDALDPRLKN